MARKAAKNQKSTPAKKKAVKKSARKRIPSKKAPAKATAPTPGRDPETGQFINGNRFWKLCSSAGRKPIFASPEQLWDACCEYFEWVTSHPLMSAELVKYKDHAALEDVPKMRAMTIGALCIFLDIAKITWDDYGKKPDFSTVVTRVNEIIRAQKFEGAAAELLNPNIIAREIGLADRKEHTGKDGAPIQVSGAITDMPPAFKTIDEWVAWQKRMQAEKDG